MEIAVLQFYLWLKIVVDVAYTIMTCTFKEMYCYFLSAWYYDKVYESTHIVTGRTMFGSGFKTDWINSKLISVT